MNAGGQLDVAKANVIVVLEMSVCASLATGAWASSTVTLSSSYIQKREFRFTIIYLIGRCFFPSGASKGQNIVLTEDVAFAFTVGDSQIISSRRAK